MSLNNDFVPFKYLRVDRNNNVLSPITINNSANTAPRTALYENSVQDVSNGSAAENTYLDWLNPIGATGRAAVRVKNGMVFKYTAIGAGPANITASQFAPGSLISLLPTGAQTYNLPTAQEVIQMYNLSNNDFFTVTIVNSAQGAGNNATINPHNSFTYTRDTAAAYFLNFGPNLVLPFGESIIMYCVVVDDVNFIISGFAPVTGGGAGDPLNNA